MKKIIISLLLLISLAVSAATGGVVIVNKDNQLDFSDKQIRKIFLGKLKTLSNGNTITPIVLSGERKIKTEFNKKILGKTDKDVKIYWAKKLFTGKGIPPKTIKNSKALIQYVIENKTVMGFVTNDAAQKLSGEIRIIKIF